MAHEVGDEEDLLILEDQTSDTIYPFLWKMLIMVKGKKLFFHPLINAKLVIVLVPSLVLNQFHVLLVAAKAK